VWRASATSTIDVYLVSRSLDHPTQLLEGGVVLKHIESSRGVGVSALLVEEEGVVVGDGLWEALPARNRRPQKR